jgi:hypothetical protein
MAGDWAEAGQGSLGILRRSDGMIEMFLMNNSFNILVARLSIVA